MAAVEERFSRLEGSYEHLAAKSDIANLRADMASLKAELIKWMVGTLVVGIVATATIVRAIS